MIRRLLLLLLVLAAAPAATCRAQAWGVALRWDACFGEGIGAFTKSFACDSNAGTDRLVGSFATPAEMSDVTGNEIVIDLVAGRPTPVDYPPRPAVPLPAWWEFIEAGACRRTSLSLNVVADAANSTCQDWAQGQAVCAIRAYQLGVLGPGTARLVMESATLGAPRRLSASAEQYSFTLMIRHDKTAGDGACGGCQVPMVIQLAAIRVTTLLPQNSWTLSGPLNGTDSNFSIWQPASVPVPVRRASWGAVKSVFR